MASSSTWTAVQNKRFETALAIFNKDTPDYWENVTRAIGDKTVEEVKMQYEKLVEDVRMIEEGLVPLPDYRESATAKGKRQKTKTKGYKDKEKRF